MLLTVSYMPEPAIYFYFESSRQPTVMIWWS